jgi:hypothetical protein
MTRVNITLGWYPKNKFITSKLLDEINMLLDLHYEGAYTKHILKYGLRNPYKRITRNNANKLIQALKENKQITFVDKA